MLSIMPLNTEELPILLIVDDFCAETSLGFVSPTNDL